MTDIHRRLDHQQSKLTQKCMPDCGPGYSQQTWGGEKLKEISLTITIFINNCST